LRDRDLTEAAIRWARAQHKSPLAKDVAKLSSLFTTERAERKHDYMRDPALRRAYVAFYLPQYASKIALLLEQNIRDGVWSPPPSPRVLDVGSGPLTGIFGAWIARGMLGDAFAVDIGAATMDVGKQLAQDLGVDVQTRVTSILSDGWLPSGKLDLVVIAHVLNEIGDPRRALETRADVIAQLIARLDKGGRILVVEPGTRVHARSLQALRDMLVERKIASVLSPCRAAEKCPLLERPGDWCHAERPWNPPEIFVELSRAANIPKDVLKDSHLLLAHPSEPMPTDALRLVGGVMRDRNGVERRYGCGKHGLVTLEGAPRLLPDIGRPYRGALYRGPVPEERPRGVQPAKKRRRGR
jgi:ribosomal protein RSM22 (predicted rRNA methylase)